MQVSIRMMQILDIVTHTNSFHGRGAPGFGFFPFLISTGFLLTVRFEVNASLENIILCGNVSQGPKISIISSQSEPTIKTHYLLIYNNIFNEPLSPSANEGFVLLKHSVSTVVWLTSWFKVEFRFLRFTLKYKIAANLQIYLSLVVEFLEHPLQYVPVPCSTYAFYCTNCYVDSLLIWIFASEKWTPFVATMPNCPIIIRSSIICFSASDVIID